MAKQHEVEQGETLPEIARRYGFLNWELIRDHPDNQELFATRREGLLHPGDRITIPERDPSRAAAGTRAKHTYVVPRPRRFLRLRLLDGANEPLPNYAYELHIGREPPREGSTDGDGVIHVELPERASRARLVVETPADPPDPSSGGPVLAPATRYERELDIGHLDPATQLSGVHARLQNLGYFFAKIADPYTHLSRLAVYKFKLDWVEQGEDEELDGELDDATLARLVEVHDNVATKLSFAEELPAPVPQAKQRTRPLVRHLVAPVAVESDATFNSVRLSPPPDLVFDAHMHIQSNNCAPMPLVWGRLPGLAAGVSRSKINWTARTWLASKITGEFGVVGSKVTDQVGDIAARRNRDTFEDEGSFPRTNGDEARLTPMIVLPMDMEMAHLDGYFGEPIYYALATRKERSYTDYVPSYSVMIPPTPITAWEPIGPALPRLVDPSTRAPYTSAQKLEAEAARDAAVREQGQDTREVSFAQLHGTAGKFYYYIDYDMDDWADDNAAQKWTVKFVADEEYDLYETFHEQRERTLIAAVRNPWSYLPLFHYDPRRWQLGAGAQAGSKGVAAAWDAPFEEVATASHEGPYIGFKMYTPLGYKPSDYERWLPRMADYFGRCESEQIPILAHCTPGGMYTNERELYYETEPESVKRTLRTRRGRDPSKADRITWYSDAFVSPSAWRPVLERYRSLKLCLAHFVGDDWDDWHGSVRRNMATRLVMGERDPSVWWNSAGTGPWLKDMVRLIEDFDNVYTDISYFDVTKHEAAFAWLLEAYPKLKKRINFGTDWYMVENDIKGYDNYCRLMKGAIDRVGAEVFPDDPIPLWERVTRDNPLRCYRLLDCAPNWAAGLKAWNASYARVARRQNKPWAKAAHDEKINRGLQQFMRVSHLDPS